MNIQLNKTNSKLTDESNDDPIIKKQIETNKNELEKALEELLERIKDPETLKFIPEELR